MRSPAPYALGAGLLNGIAHFVFPILKGGYFPCLYTAAGHLVASGLLIYVLVREERRLKAAEQQEQVRLPVAQA